MTLQQFQQQQSQLQLKQQQHKLPLMQEPQQRFEQFGQSHFQGQAS